MNVSKPKPTGLDIELICSNVEQPTPTGSETELICSYVEQLITSDFFHERLAACQQAGQREYKIQLPPFAPTSLPAWGYMDAVRDLVTRTLGPMTCEFKDDSVCCTCIDSSDPTRIRLAAHRTTPTQGLEITLKW